MMRNYPDRSHIVVQRQLKTRSSYLNEQTRDMLDLWKGEALVRQITSTAQRLPGGQIKTATIAILVVGEHDFRIGDFVQFKSDPYFAREEPEPPVKHVYQVQRVKRPFQAATMLELNMSQQQPLS